MSKKRELFYQTLEFQTNRFDIIGDIHGCYQELLRLVSLLGYQKTPAGFVHPEGRRLVSVGDIINKGPENVNCMRFWIRQVACGGLWVHGNHCQKLYRYLLGQPVKVQKGLEHTVAELMALPKEERTALTQAYLRAYESQPYFVFLDKKRLAVVHAAFPDDYSPKGREHAKEVCLYGEKTGERDATGSDKRKDWVSSYNGRAFVVYGHTVTEKPALGKKTAGIDQGCVYGGHLTALRYPERTLVQVAGKPYIDLNKK